jgi:hypothetical protein
VAAATFARKHSGYRIGLRFKNRAFRVADGSPLRRARYDPGPRYSSRTPILIAFNVPRNLTPEEFAQKAASLKTL